MKTIIKQTLEVSVQDRIDLAEKYYGMLSIVNNLELRKGEIQLLAFAAIKGNMTFSNVRKEFRAKYNTTNPSINNIICKLKKQGIILKEGKINMVNPIIVLDFDKDLKMEINLKHGKASEHVTEGVVD